MNDQMKKSSGQALAAGFLGFVGVVGLGSSVIFHHNAEAAAPVVVYAPVEVDSSMPAPPQVAKPGFPGVSSPAPLLSDEARGEDAAAAQVVAPNAPVTTAAAALVVSRHLDGTASASSSASASATATAAVAPKPKGLPAIVKKYFFTPKLDLSKNKGTIASTVHYGVNSRAELMGRAAGPVYNFMRQVDAARKQVDASGVSADEKKKLDQNLDQVRLTADSVP